MEDEFVNELTALINKHSMENMSDTPDHILAQYMKDCLVAFSRASKRRDSHKGDGETYSMFHGEDGVKVR